MRAPSSLRARRLLLSFLFLLIPSRTTSPPLNSRQQHHHRNCLTSNRSLPTQADHGLRLCDCLRHPHSYSLTFIPLLRLRSASFNCALTAVIRVRIPGCGNMIGCCDRFLHPNGLRAVTDRHSTSPSRGHFDKKNHTNTFDHDLHPNGLRAVIDSHSTSPLRGHFDTKPYQPFSDRFQRTNGLRSVRSHH